MCLYRWLVSAGCRCAVSDNDFPRASLNEAAAKQQQQSHIELCLFVTATDDVSVRVCMWAVTPVDLRSMRTHAKNPKEGADTQIFRRRQDGHTNPHSLGPWTATAKPTYEIQQQQRYWSRVRICTRILPQIQYIHGTMFTFPRTISKPILYMSSNLVLPHRSIQHQYSE